MVRPAAFSPARSSEKMSTSSASCSWTCVSLGRLMRSRCVARRILANIGTYSNMIDEFSRPYQRAGEPHSRRIVYLV